MQHQEFGPRRSKETVRPSVVCPQVNFYYCSNCGNVFQALFDINTEFIPECCGRKMKLLEPKIPSVISDYISIDYRIIGGYNENAVEVFWTLKRKELSLKWIYLKTYTGGQIKYVTNYKKTSFVFALADEDAYAYCDENPCLECTFKCKRGFTVYVYIQEKGVVKIPFERMHANWQS